METTANYDEKTQKFIINSPTTLSHKYWITNGVCHSNYAIVFAQTIVIGKNVIKKIYMLKGFCTWNLERVSIICRERCGCGGYTF
jgi:hypothetical protein